MNSFNDAETFNRNTNGFSGTAELDPVEKLDRTREMMDRWVADQLFEDDVRSMLLMLRPNKHERLMGWKEYRTGGTDFRVTVSWSEGFAEKEEDNHADQVAASNRRDRALRGSASDLTRLLPEAKRELAVPRMADVIETLLVGSMKHDDDVSAQEEFEAYRQVLLEVRRRLDEMQRCYE